MPDDTRGRLSLAPQLDVDLWPRLDARLAGFFGDNQTSVTYIDLLRGDRVIYDLATGKLVLQFEGFEPLVVNGVDEENAASTAHKWAKLRTV